MNVFYGLIFIGFILYWIGRLTSASSGAGKKVSNYISLRAEPTIIEPIASWDFNACKSHLVAVDKPIPETQDSWLSMGSDHTLLTNYVAALDSHRLKVEREAQAAINRFEQDHAQLIDQQKQLFRRVFQAKKYIDPFFGELKNLKPSLDKLPAHLRITVPARPTYLAPKDVAKKYSLIPSTAGGTVGRAVFQNGGLANSSNLLGLAIAAAAFAIAAKAKISKLKRVVTDAQWQVSNYTLSLKTLVEQLEKVHEHVVTVSLQLKRAEQEIIALVGQVQAIPSGVTTLEALDADRRTDVTHLYYLLHFAEQSGRASI